MVMKRFLTVKEVSQQIGRSPARLREAIVRGEIAAVQFGPRGAIRIKQESVEVYLNANLVAPFAGRVN